MARGAEKVPGSWWPNWHEWLAGNAGPRVSARVTPGDADHPPLEDASGSYVKEEKATPAGA